jgi:DNA-binding MarR family transcriptional regulator
MGDHLIRQVKGESQSILDCIRRIVQELRVADREAEGKLGLSAAQLFVLKRLKEQPTMSVNEVAERTRTHQSSVSVVVHRLVEKGLVRREESQSDRRRVELTLTPEGKRLLTRAHHSPQDRMIEAIESMTAKRRKELAGGLAELVAAMGLSDELPAMFFETVGNAGRSTK